MLQFLGLSSGWRSPAEYAMNSTILTELFSSWSFAQCSFDEGLLRSFAATPTALFYCITAPPTRSSGFFASGDRNQHPDHSPQGFSKCFNHSIPTAAFFPANHHARMQSKAARRMQLSKADRTCGNAMYICDGQDGDMTVVERRVSLKDPVSREADLDRCLESQSIHPEN